MNANSPAKTVEIWLRQAITALEAAGIESARLDADLLLADMLHKNRAWLLAHPETVLSASQLEGLGSALAQRCKRVPLAYIRGHQEFYGREFAVDNRVLIPRPESEAIIAALHSLSLPTHGTLLDVGTGSGCLGISAALEIPALNVTLSDLCASALEVARQNAAGLGATVQLRESNLLQAFLADNSRFNVIIANLPYVARDWQRSPETDFEPKQALFADADGLALIHALIQDTPNALQPLGFLIVEADKRQHAAIIQLAAQHQLTLLRHTGLILTFRLI